MTTDREFQTRTEQIAQSIEHDLAATRLEGPTHPLPPAQAIIRELGIRNTLIARKTAEAHQKTLLSHQFFGDTPLNKDFHDYYRKAQSIDSKVSPKGIAMQAWAASYRAAHEANLLTLSIQMLNQQQVEVYKWLTTVQANDQEQAAAEAQRIAAEQARIRAESEALALAQEQTRLAAMAEAERVAVDFPGAVPRLDAVLRPLLPDEPVPPRCTVRRPQRQSGLARRLLVRLLPMRLTGPALAQGRVLQIPP